jgi:hypothetical protein
MLPSSISSSVSPTTLHCPHHSANWTIAHEHVLRALERICNDAGYATNRKRVLPSEGTRRTDLEVRNIRVAGKTDLVIDVTLRHPSSAPAAQGSIRVSSATLTTRIKFSRAPLLTRSATTVTPINAIGRWLSCPHACLPRDASMASSCVCFSSLQQAGRRLL